jgi:N-acyl-D-aspartate/D-glutamate deacylase
VALDLVLEGGSVVDGTGTTRRKADIGIAKDRIAEIGDLSRATADRRLDISGRVAVPGFVDIHTHSDLSVLSDGRARSKVMQGVTTEVVGNCGFSPFPSPEAKRAAVRQSVALIDVDRNVAWSWDDFGGYVEALNAAHPALNVVPMAGHIPLRVSTAGFDKVAKPAELRRKLEASLAAGAPGFSTGLMYPPAMWAGQSELVALAKVARAHGRLFSVHMRDYGDRLVEAVEETLAVATRAGVRLQVSHLAVAGRRNWGKVTIALELIDKARSSGLDVAIDIYPYIAGSANLSQLLPEWAQAGTPDDMVARLGERSARDRVLEEWASNLRFGWDEIELSWMPAEGTDGIGLSVMAIAERMHVPGGEAALRLIEQSDGQAQMVAYGRSEDDLEAVLGDPLCVLGSDGLALDPDGPSGAGRPHPRSFGSFPRLLARYVRERGLLSLERAVQMATSAPADRLGLKDRGRVAVGNFADVCVIDPESVRDTATFQDPKRFPVGIDHLFVNGVQVVADGLQQYERRPGRVLTCA